MAFCALAQIIFCFSSASAFNAPLPTASRAANLDLTPAERSWIAGHPVIRIQMSPDFPPFEMRHAGAWQGMAYDYLVEAAGRLGLRIEVTGLSWPEAVQKIRAGREVDLLLTVMNSPERAELVELTKPYLTFPQVIVTRKEGNFVANLNNIDRQIVAVEKGYLVANRLRRDLPSAGIIETEDSLSALKMVSTGRAEAYVGNLAMAVYLIEHEGLVNLKIAAPSDYGNESFSMGVRKDWPELARLLDKALDSFSAEDHARIRQKWLSVRFDHGIQPHDVILWIALLIAGALAFIIPLRIMVRRQTGQLRSQKRLVDAVMDNTFQYQALLTPNGSVLYVNKAALALVDVTLEEIFGRQFWETPWWSHDPLEQKRLQYAVAQCADGSFVRYEATHKGNGGTRYSDFSLKPLRDDSGAITHLIAEGRDITERILAEEALRESQARFQAIFDESPIAITLNELTRGAYVDVNRRYCELTGKSKDQVIGRNALQLEAVTPDEHARLMEILREKGMIDQEEITVTAQGGGSRTSILSTRIIDIAGAPYSLSMLLDITERKQAEAALREREEQLALYIRRLPIACILCDTDFRVQRWNPAAERVFGYTEAEALGKTAIDLIVPTWHRVMIESMWQQLISGAIQNSVNDNITRDGRIITCEWTNTPFMTPSGNVTGVISMAQDITEKRQAEIALKASEEKLRSIAASVSDVIWVMDDDFRFIFASPSVERVHGWKVEELLALSLQDALPPYSLGKAMEVVAEELAWWHAHPGEQGRVRMMELELLRADGNSFWGEISATFVDAGDGTTFNIVGITRDISDRKKTEQIMIQTEKMMMVSGLAAGMAHEINNPLGIIVQGVQNTERRLQPNLEANIEVATEIGLDLGLMREYLHRREILGFFTSMRRAGERASTIIANMLAFSRMSSSGHLPAHLHQVIDRAIDMALSDYDLKKKYDIRNVRFVREYAAEMPLVRINETEIEQVLINLFKNAAQAMTHEETTPEPIIRIRTAQDHGYAVITVADNGPGMTDEVKKRIFEPFYTTKEVGVGTGLGLYVSYAIITSNHKGTITVTSEPGEGASFAIRLPTNG